LRARIGHLTTRLQGTWDGQGLLGRLSSASVVMVGGIAALGLALVAFVSAQGWPGGLTSPGFTPTQLIDLAPGGGDTAVSDNRVAGRPPAPTRSGAAFSPSSNGGAFGTASRSSSGGSPGPQATRHRGAAAQGGHSGGVTPSAAGAGKHGGGVPAHEQASRPAPAPAGEDSNGNGHAYGHDKNGGPPPKHNSGSATDRRSPAAAPPSPAHKSHGKALGHSKSGGAGKGHGKGHRKG
jgi:hypothetical protein